jgi:ferredoxin-NADP reductase
VQPIAVRLAAVVRLAEGILSFEFQRKDGTDLPAFCAGAHIDVHLRPGFVRQYSLCNDPRERHRYVIAVLREEAGRGGSRILHDELTVGDELTISPARNFFPLATDARRHLLLAGGIGITPMMSMVAELSSRGEDFFLHYCTRSAAKTAFLGRVEALVAAGRAALHHDGGHPDQGLDLQTLLLHHELGTHLYGCGPAGFMQAVAACSSHWPRQAVHFEYFSAPGGATAPPPEDRSFRIKLVRSALELDVPADRTIVDVLREHDVFIETSCKEGYCGTCLTRYLAGEVEHRDTVLDEKDRREFLLVCRSRARTPILELDL